mmetsp:Transcript_91780/g.163350  ORF Transcript_91780/g.163350 Transcript_91780/m.163350 type:complete len:96 (+) Transcript_91780:76-363(+)|eukprot:CAMPEP_0197647248 /NCGR_PEP_ID=MMETSP1338-20131121/24694_1 /TAXON_ID=43686 ORGANISM="Pelagodinium beii, Strain RCC1491" /NCGR_SAMPLE_ID=MMETSP1338 /ASSEMBLY_ACC=CAM_ASM_000754 /LENGTH=95 /DNA_ID=CAMNT_0043221005 /DNA_START=70 /DNA_END=357 /DNA_ORIENTATION=-
MSNELNRLKTPKDKEDYLRQEVRPLLEDMSANYWSTAPAPEDIVAFFIDTLTHKYGLAEPPTGALDEDTRHEVTDIEYRIKTLKREIEVQLEKLS